MSQRIPPSVRERSGRTRSTLESAHRHRRDRRHDCRPCRVHDRCRIPVRRGRRRCPHRRRAANEEVRRRPWRAGVVGRQSGHERRALGDARDRSQSSAGGSRRRRGRHHARHRYDGGNRVLPQSRRQKRQAGRPHWFDATVHVARRRWPVEHLQRGRRGVRSEGERTWRAGGRERRYPRCACDDQASHHRRPDVRLTGSRAGRRLPVRRS